MHSSVVIGVNWGDEGKGLMTDYLCRRRKADLVVRFNGGAQAGHTVVTPEGERHVFAHIGAGYFAGVPTYLSRYFIVNPILFREEYEELKVPESYKIMVDRRCEITTYWDMLANRAIEEMRGEGRHGSCGAGVWATQERRTNGFSFSVVPGMLSKKNILDSLVSIKKYWFRNLHSIFSNRGKPMPEWVCKTFQRSEDINRRFIEDIEFMCNHVEVPDCFSEITRDYHYAIFEGAQGLGLDPFYGNYPYVTGSNTGMRNVLKLQRDGDYTGKGNFDIDEIVYVSRTYETRHGADPDFEGSEQLAGVSDKTNVPNEWQGRMRYRNLNYLRLARRMYGDISSNNLEQYNESGKVKLAMTHADQLPVPEDRKRPAYISYGETWRDVVAAGGRG
jgi:adenylosuccinate synthase